MQSKLYKKMIESQGRSNVATELMIYHMNVILLYLVSPSLIIYLFCSLLRHLPLPFISSVHQNISLFRSIYAAPLSLFSTQPSHSFTASFHHTHYFSLPHSLFPRSVHYTYTHPHYASFRENPHLKTVHPPTLEISSIWT